MVGSWSVALHLPDALEVWPSHSESGGKTQMPRPTGVWWHWAVRVHHTPRWFAPTWGLSARLSSMTRSIIAAPSTDGPIFHTAYQSVVLTRVPSSHPSPEQSSDKHDDHIRQLNKDRAAHLGSDTGYSWWHPPVRQVVVPRTPTAACARTASQTPATLPARRIRNSVLYCAAIRPLCP